MSSRLQFQPSDPAAPRFHLKFKETQDEGFYFYHNLIWPSHVDTFQDLSDVVKLQLGIYFNCSHYNSHLIATVYNTGRDWVDMPVSDAFS
jgi:hypothetical protein